MEESFAIGKRFQDKVFAAICTICIGACAWIFHEYTDTVRDNADRIRTIEARQQVDEVKMQTLESQLSTIEQQNNKILELLINIDKDGRR